MNIPNTTMLKPTDLAEMWHISPARLANMRSAGVGPAFVRIGASVRYRQADIEAYEAANLVRPIGA